MDIDDTTIKKQMDKIIIELGVLELFIAEKYLKDDMYLKDEKTFSLRMNHFLKLSTLKSELEFSINQIIQPQNHKQ